MQVDPLERNEIPANVPGASPPVEKALPKSLTGRIIGAGRDDADVPPRGICVAQNVPSITGLQGCCAGAD
jgi:hypothetical protein